MFVKAPARRIRLLCLACLTFGVLCQTSGCAVNIDAVITAAADAVLTSVSDSLVESLSTYLEGT